jgi:NAD(P)-dependent dehydrogenase (short-subunit alcohol dehydrogenase family)
VTSEEDTVLVIRRGRRLARRRNPARRIGTPADIARGVLFALTNTFLIGQTLHIDSGEPLT